MATFNPNLTIQTSGVPEEQKPAVQPVDAIASVPLTPVPNMPVLNEQPITPVASAAPNNQAALQTQLTTLQQQLIPLLEQQKKQQEAQVAATETTTPTEEPATPAEQPTEEPTDSFGTILSQFGINEQQSLEDVIKSVSAAYGLEGINDEITKLDDSFIEKTADINDNPWLSEGIRATKVAGEKAKYEQKKDALINQLRLRQDVVGKAIETYYREREFKKDLLFKTLDMRQKQLDTQKGTGISPTADITEYSLAVDQGYAGSFLDYQREVANLKQQAITSAGLTPQQTQNFLRVSDKFQADEIIKLGNKGSFTLSIADQIIANPNNATNQLKALYTLIKNLDPDSAVREGELALAERTQSYFSNFANYIGRITSGRVISPNAAIELAEASKDLANLWIDAAERRESQYRSQANVAGVGGAFGEYLGGFPEKRRGDISEEDKTAKLNAMLLGPEENIESDPEGFFNSFLGIFGLQTK